MNLPPPPGATPEAKAARSAGAAQLGLDAESVQATIVFFEGDVRAYRVHPSGTPTPPGAGVMLFGLEPILAVADVRRSEVHGRSPSVLAAAVAVLHDGSFTAPLKPNRHAPDVKAPAFDSEGRLVFQYRDAAARGVRMQAVVRFAEDGTLADIARTTLGQD